MSWFWIVAIITTTTTHFQKVSTFVNSLVDKNIKKKLVKYPFKVHLKQV